jgi:hypothetical protein
MLDAMAHFSPKFDKADLKLVQGTKLRQSEQKVDCVRFFFRQAGFMCIAAATCFGEPRSLSHPRRKRRPLVTTKKKINDFAVFVGPF